MIRHHFFGFFCCTLWALSMFSSCKTEDIEPVISIAVDSVQNSRISENSGVALVSASLSGKATKEVRLMLSFSGTATLGVDYIVSSNEIVIPAGMLSASVKITAMQDGEVEGDETIIINFGNLQDAILANQQPISITISDDDIDTDNDGLPDALDDCPLDSGAVENNGCPTGFGIFFNEVHYDPSNVALDGDANGDGVYDQNQDEFAEIVNNTNLPQDISGFTLSDLVIASDESIVRFTFPPGTILPPKKVCVVFGGGTPTGTFGGATVFTCTQSAGLSMQNSGEKVLVKDPSGNLLQTFDSDALSDNPNRSYTRNPDITGDFVPHNTANPSKLFSPGTKIDNSPF